MKKSKFIFVTRARLVATGIESLKALKGWVSTILLHVISEYLV